MVDAIWFVGAFSRTKFTDKLDGIRDHGEVDLIQATLFTFIIPKSIMSTLLQTINLVILSKSVRPAAFSGNCPSRANMNRT